MGSIIFAFLHLSSSSSSLLLLSNGARHELFKMYGEKESHTDAKHKFTQLSRPPTIHISRRRRCSVCTKLSRLTPSFDFSSSSSRLCMFTYLLSGVGDFLQ